MGKMWKNVGKMWKNVGNVKKKKRFMHVFYKSYPHLLKVYCELKVNKKNKIKKSTKKNIYTTTRALCACSSYQQLIFMWKKKMQN